MYVWASKSVDSPVWTPACRNGRKRTFAGSLQKTLAMLVDMYCHRRVWTFQYQFPLFDAQQKQIWLILIEYMPHKEVHHLHVAKSDFYGKTWKKNVPRSRLSEVGNRNPKVDGTSFAGRRCCNRRNGPPKRVSKNNEKYNYHMQSGCIRVWTLQ